MVEKYVTDWVWRCDLQSLLLWPQCKFFRSSILGENRGDIYQNEIVSWQGTTSGLALVQNKYISVQFDAFTRRIRKWMNALIAMWNNTLDMVCVDTHNCRTEDFNSSLVAASVGIQRWEVIEGKQNWLFRVSIVWLNLQSHCLVCIFWPSTCMWMKSVNDFKVTFPVYWPIIHMSTLCPYYKVGPSLMPGFVC